MRKIMITVLAFFLVVAAFVIWRALPRAAPGVQGGLGDLRSLISAEHSYSSSNGGYFDEPSCLADPSRCIPGYPTTGPAFIEPRLGDLPPRTGYAFEFHPGPRPELEDAERDTVSGSSILSFAVVAVPVEEGSRLRAFCADSSGRLCAWRDATEAQVVGSRCPDTCETLR